MQRTHKPWFRGAITLGVLAAFGAAMLISNAGAVSEKKEASKKYVKRRVAALRNELSALESGAAGPTGLQQSFTTLVSLDLPAGMYVLMAKTVVELPIENPHCECQLLVGGAEVDQSRASLSEATDVRAEEMTLMAVHTLSVPAAVVLQCRQNDSGDVAAASSSKLVAVRVP